MNELKNLQIEEVSLVDEGANPEANIVLLKRKPNDLPKPDVTNLETERAELAKAKETVESLIGTLKEYVSKVEDAEALEVAKRYELLGHKAEELAPKLKSLKKFPEMYEAVIQSFESALSAVTKAQTFDEIGKSGRNSGVVEIEKIAKEIRKSEPNLDWRAALDAAYQAHPELRD